MLFPGTGSFNKLLCFLITDKSIFLQYFESTAPQILGFYNEEATHTPFSALPRHPPTLISKKEFLVYKLVSTGDRSMRYELSSKDSCGFITVNCSKKKKKSIIKIQLVIKFKVSFPTGLYERSYFQLLQKIFSDITSVLK